jgi:hypothetical protein
LEFIGFGHLCFSIIPCSNHLQASLHTNLEKLSISHIP